MPPPRLTFCSLLHPAHWHSKSNEDDKILCNICTEIQERKEYCPVCKLVQVQISQTMIQCTCQMWIHRECDPILANDSVYQLYVQNESKAYICPICRKKLILAEMHEFVQILAQ